MKKPLLLLAIILSFSCTVKAQKGDNLFQISGQASLPTSNLADVVKTGFGAAIKGMYGFGVTKQHVTLEVGYDRFSVKNLPSGVDASYSAVPIYTGYRYTIGNFNLEPQAGISINKVAGSSSVGSASSTSTNFGWATGVSYSFTNLELGVKYQSSEIKNSDDNLTFVGIRLAYNFSL
ncbi:MAG: outer membrane beta-barrel protein [Bacteroidota bacterium]